MFEQTKRDEKWMKVFIASESQIKILISTGTDYDGVSRVNVGDTVHVTCQADHIGQPLPNIDILVNNQCK